MAPMILPTTVAVTLPVAVLAGALDTSEAAIAIVAMPGRTMAFANTTFLALGCAAGKAGDTALFSCAATDAAVAEALQSGHTARIARFSADWDGALRHVTGIGRPSYGGRQL